MNNQFYETGKKHISTSTIFTKPVSCERIGNEKMPGRSTQNEPKFDYFI